jgi:hypothetical protein
VGHLAGDVVDLVEGDVARVLDVLLLLAVPRGLCGVSAGRGAGRGDGGNGGMTTRRSGRSEEMSCFDQSGSRKKRIASAGEHKKERGPRARKATVDERMGQQEGLYEMKRK